MKRRIRIDSVILAFFIIVTGVLFQFPRLYSTNLTLDQILNFLGFATVLKGVFLRMVARGHKKAHSDNGQGLVSSGPYRYVRNPMYLGSFLLGLGFIFLLWPWWMFPIYIGVFYWRFRIQIIKEEEYLDKNFGEAFQAYCQKVPRLFPDIRRLFKADIRQDFSWAQAWSTKERNGFFAWPIVALFMELWQEKFVFGYVSWQPTFLIFLCALVLFSAKLWLIYKKV